MRRDQTRTETRRDKTNPHAQLTTLYTDAIHQVMRLQPINVCCVHVYASDTAAMRPERLAVSQQATSVALS